MECIRVLDLFCGGGGAAMGYYQAGLNYDIWGVDIHPQKNYPFTFIQDDWLSVLHDYGDRFDFIHASPPCQRYSVISKSWNGNPDNHPDFIDAVRIELRKLGKPYAIENVPGAPLINPITLCGSMFDLRVIRHRLFECNFSISVTASCNHGLCYTKDKRKKHYGKLNEMTAFVQVTGGGNCSKRAAADAMGIDWMTKQEMNEAIPPAYTKYIAEQWLKTL